MVGEGGHALVRLGLVNLGRQRARRTVTPSAGMLLIGAPLVTVGIQRQRLKS
jgi:hypothetical protein